jgi:hypothetical protein
MKMVDVEDADDDESEATFQERCDKESTRTEMQYTSKARPLTDVCMYLDLWAQERNVKDESAEHDGDWKEGESCLDENHGNRLIRKPFADPLLALRE